MISPELLNILRCPETRQKLSFVDAAELEELNQRISQGQLHTPNGTCVIDRLDGGLVREDGKRIYPVRGNLPILLIDEAIVLVP